MRIYSTQSVKREGWGDVSQLGPEHTNTVTAGQA